MDKRRIKLGIIGYGYWGPNLLRNFSQLDSCDVVAVADTEPKRRQAARRAYPWIREYDSGDALLSECDLDAVAIATPVSTHFRLVKSSLEANKHVLVEKPLCSSAAEVRTLTKIASDQKRILMTDYTFIYSGAVRKIKQLISNGEIGDIHYYDAVRVNLGLFQHDINVLWDLAPHDFSILLYLFDKKPAHILAIGAKPIATKSWNMESIAYVSVRFSNGTLANFHLNWLSPVKIRRTLIGGSRRMIVYDHLDLDNQIKIYDKGVDVLKDEQRVQTLVQYRTGDMTAPKIPQEEALQSVCEHFIDCIQNEKTPLTGGAFSEKVIHLVERAQESMDQQGKLIQL